MDDRLVELMEQFDERVRARAGSPDVLAETRQLEPATRRELAEVVRCLRMIDRVRRANGPKQHAAPSPDARAAAEGEHPLRVGRFEIVRELGRGGHGIVFLAWDPAARRRVALKTPHPDALFTPELRERFLREGIAAARLTHPNIISVLEVDRSGPLCYIVSAYSEGRSLATVLADALSAISPRVAAKWVAELADGVEHAHRHGILHRDLKPANVVLESASLASDGDVGMSTQDNAAPAPADALAELVPKLTDFGLAKLVDSLDTRTRTGVMLGTPAYMAPEQVDGALGKVGPGTDVYGLGTILYECLTGGPPFSADSQADLLRQIASGEPTAPRSRRGDLPRDLEAICLRALARRPRDRYASAAALAADLRRYLAGEVTVARPLGALGASLKWARRRPAAAAALVVAVLAALVLGAGAMWHFAKLNSALEVTQRARARAEQGEREMRQLIYFRDMQEAHRALDEQDVLKASAALARHRPGASGHQPGFLWRHLRARAHGLPIEVAAHRGHAHTVDFSPDGKHVVTTGADGLLQIWNSATGEKQATLASGAPEVNCAVYSPNGATIAAADSDCHLRLWDVAQRELTAAFRPDELENINCLVWSQDGRRVIAAGSPGDVAIEWDASTGQSRAIPLRHADEVNRIALSPDERYLASASSDGTVHVHDIAQGVRVANIDPRQNHVTCVAFSPYGQWLATAGVHKSVKIYNVDDWTLTATYQGHAERIGAIVFSPRDPVLAFCDGVGAVREWDWVSDRIVRAVDGQHGRIMSAAYSPTTPCFAATGSDGSLCIWDRRREEPLSESFTDRFGADAAFTLDSRYLVTRNTWLEVGLFDTQKRTAPVVVEAESPDAFAYGLVAVSDHGIGTLHKVSGKNVFRYGPVRGPLRDVILQGAGSLSPILATPDGRFLVTANELEPYAVHIWDLDTGRPVGTIGNPGEVTYAMTLDARGDLLAVAGAGAVGIYDLKTRTRLRTLVAETGAVPAVAFADDGCMLAGALDDGRVWLWNARTGARSSLVLRHEAQVRCLAFCPDEPVLVTGDRAGNVRAWSLASGEELIHLGQLADKVQVVAFSPDAQWLVAGYSDDHQQQLRVWQAPR